MQGRELRSSPSDVLAITGEGEASRTGNHVASTPWNADDIIDWLQVIFVDLRESYLRQQEHTAVP